MGSYYHLFDEKCPHCREKIAEIIYATCYEDYNADGEWMGNHEICKYCGKKFEVKMEFKLIKE